MKIVRFFALKNSITPQKCEGIFFAGNGPFELHHPSTSSLRFVIFFMWNSGNCRTHSKERWNAINRTIFFFLSTKARKELPSSFCVYLLSSFFCLIFSFGQVWKSRTKGVIWEEAYGYLSFFFPFSFRCFKEMWVRECNVRIGKSSQRPKARSKTLINLNSILSLWKSPVGFAAAALPTACPPWISPWRQVLVFQGTAGWWHPFYVAEGSIPSRKSDHQVLLFLVS